MTSFPRLIFRILPILTLSATVWAAPIYTVTQLQHPVTDSPVDVSGLNNAGQVFGSYSIIGGGSGAYIGTISGSTPVPQPQGVNGSGGLGAINDSGQVAWGTTANFTFPVFGTTASTQALPMPAGMLSGTVYGLNNSGVAVGTGQNTNSSSQGFISSIGGASRIPFLAGFTQGAALDINSSGQVVGYGYSTAPGPTQAFIGNASAVAALPTPAGWTDTHATSINDSGAVVGWGMNGGVAQAFYTAGGTSTPIPLTPGSSGVIFNISLNSLGVVAGGSFSGAWIWDSTNGTRRLSDLTPPGSTFTEVVGINDLGQIAVRGFVPGVGVDYFLLTPVASNIPEPSSAILVLSGLAALAWKRKRSSR